MDGFTAVLCSASPRHTGYILLAHLEELRYSWRGFRRVQKISVDVLHDKFNAIAGPGEEHLAASDGTSRWAARKLGKQMGGHPQDFRPRGEVCAYTR